MDRNPNSNYVKIRPVILTVLLAVFAILAAADIAYLTHIVGHFLLMCAMGVLAVIFMTCDKTVFFLNTAALMAILFFTSGNSLTITLLGAVLALGALALSVAVGKKSTKTSTVLTVCVTVSLGYILVAAVMYAAEGNSLAIDDLFERLNSVFDLKFVCLLSPDCKSRNPIGLKASAHVFSASPMAFVTVVQV